MMDLNLDSCLVLCFLFSYDFDFVVRCYFQQAIKCKIRRYDTIKARQNTFSSTVDKRSCRNLKVTSKQRAKRSL